MSSAFVPRFLAIVLIFSSVGHFARADETKYVLSRRVELRAEPRMSASALEAVERGDALTVVEQRGIWARVRTAHHLGWIPASFLSDRAPSGEWLDTSVGRGLHKPRYRPDFEALKEMERFELRQEDLDNFRSSARLSAF